MEESSQATADCQNNDLILPDGWEAVLVENNRWFYLHETQKTCCWLPPAQSWQSRRGLPYGWELARSNDGRRYYINHLTKETVRCFPSSSDTTFATSIPPRTREVVISRHSDIGYGFVAGSEKPVLIRSVAEDGPSAGKLHANDQILKINGEDVRDLPQADVILRIKQFTHELSLEVIANDDVQDAKNLGQRKSSIMSRTTRERRRSNPVSVRFAETPVLVQYVGSPPTLPLRRSSLPLIPNVLKIFLENGQTRSFLYNPGTTVKDLFSSLGEKIGLKKLDRFSLVLQATQSLNDSYVQGNERASQIYLKRNCSSSAWLCKLLLVFAPKDIHFLLREDPVAFDYFYQQMCSQVVEGRFGWELKYETAIKLAALHIQQYALEEKVGKGGKISVKAIEKEVGSLDTFVPSAIINTMQKKDLHRVLSRQIKQTRNLCPPGQKYIFPLQAKLQYLKICSEMRTYGGKQFNAVVVDPTEEPKFFPDQKLASVIFIGPNVGLSQVTNPRSFSMHRIAEFSQIIGLVVTPHTEGKQNLKLFLTDGKSVTLILGPIYETRDLVHLINGYCKYLVENAKPLSIIDMTTTANVDEPTDQVPSYSNRHRVIPDEWNYNEIGQGHNEDLKDMDFLQKPKFNNNEEYSMINGSEASKQVNKQQICNGSVKTNWTSQINTSESLESINEEATRLAVDDPVEQLLVNSPELFDEVDAPKLKRKSVVNLSDDLLSESTDDEEIVNETHEVKKIENDHVEFDQTNSTNNNVPVVILDDVSKSSNNKAPSHSDQSPPDDSACVKLSHDDDDHLANPTLGNIAKLNGLCNTNDRSPSHLHEDNVDLREDNVDRREGNEDLRERNGDLRERNEDLREENGDLCEGNGDVREGNGDLREGNGDLREGSEDLREGNGDLREGNGDLREDNVDLREGNEDLLERNGDLRERNEDLHEENGDLCEGNGDLREGNGDLREGNGDLREGSEDLRERNEGLHEGNEDLREGNGDLHESPVDLSESSAHNSSDDSTTLELSSLGAFDSINSSPAPSPLTLGGASSPKEEVSIMTNGLDISHEECGGTTTKDGGVFPSDRNNNEGNHSLIATSDKNHVKDGTHGLIIINDKNNGSEDVSLSKRDLDGTASAGNTPYKVNGHKEVNIAIVDMTEALNSTENIKFDKKTEPVRLRRRKSSGFLPSLVNGHLHPTIYTPECIILDTITSDDVRGNPTGSSYPEQITSRSKACNHVLKIIYSLKTKLSSLIHTNHSVRTSNENLQTRKQLMIDKITVLEQCVKQIRQLATTDEKKIVEAVLRLSRALSLLTESCAMLYNGQYSMKNFTEKLLEVLDTHIDVLIMTDAWSSTDVSDMSVELHEDHCDIVCNSLGFLRKIINSL